MKRILASVLALIMLLSLTACGGGGKPQGCEGKYVSVAVTAFGYTMTGEDAAGFTLELKPGGRGTCTIEGDSSNLKWSLNGSKMTVTIDGTELVGDYSKDQINFVDFMGMGLDCLFAIEGSDAAKNAGSQAIAPVGGADPATSVTYDDDMYPIYFYAVSCEKDGEAMDCMGDYVVFTDDYNGMVCYSEDLYDITWTWFDDDSFEFVDEEGDTFEGYISEDDSGIRLAGSYFGYEYVYKCPYYPIRYDAVYCELDGEECTCEDEYVELYDDGSGKVCFGGELYDITWVWYEDDSFEFTDEEGDTFSGVNYGNMLIGDYFGFGYVYALAD